MVKKLQCTDVTRSFEICTNFKRKINDKKVTRCFHDPMSSLSNAKKISMNW